MGIRILCFAGAVAHLGPRPDVGVPAADRRRGRAAVRRRAARERGPRAPRLATRTVHRPPARSVPARAHPAVSDRLRPPGGPRVSLFGPVPDAVDELICSAPRLPRGGHVGPALEQPEAAHARAPQGVARVRRAPRAPRARSSTCAASCARRARRRSSRSASPVMSPAARRAHRRSSSSRWSLAVALHARSAGGSGTGTWGATARSRWSSATTSAEPVPARRGAASPGTALADARRLAPGHRGRALRARRHRAAAQPARRRHARRTTCSSRSSSRTPARPRVRGVLVVDRGWVEPGADGSVDVARPRPRRARSTLTVRLRHDEPASNRTAPAGQVQAISVAQVLAGRRRRGSVGRRLRRA